MQQPQQPRYFLFFFFVRLRSTRFILSAYVLNISNVYHADLYRGSVNLHLRSLNRQRMWEIDWAHAITCVCPSGWVMYICENRLSCPRKAKYVLTSTLCWSAETLKVALKVKMISAALHIIITLHISNESAFWMCKLVEWTVEDPLKDSPLPPPCGATMKLHWLTACLEHAG